jgi:phosphopantothenoylcysteine decarboxylase/phosphopantothenate--cysteine ligase
VRPVLLTAGATRNRVDAIRYLSAHATGRTGVDLADRLAASGRRVHLLGSEEACLRAMLLQASSPAPTLTHETFEGTRDLMARVERALRAAPDSVLLHSAAVGDYEMENAEAGKIPSGRDHLTLTLVPAPKIVDRVRGWAPDCFLVSFKAAAPGTSLGALEAIARAQAHRTGSDLVFANVLGDIGHDVLLVSADATRHFPQRRDALAALLAALPA